MAWQMIRSRTRTVISTMTAAALRPFSVDGDPFKCSPFSGINSSFLGSCRNGRPVWNTVAGKLEEAGHSRSGLATAVRERAVLRVEASASLSSPGLAQELKSFKVQNICRTDSGQNLFNEMKQRFMYFKKHKYLEQAEHFQALAQMQSPKFMVIACVDSRVCPSNILGFQPGEAFMVRNVANLVPPLENGPTETNAALEFAVNTLEVDHLFVIGHSNCAGIQTLMNMQDGETSSFVEKWVANAKIAKLTTKADATHLTFDQMCKNCEKESINRSLQNLLTYPWIEDRLRKGLLSVHGGYYDFLNCTFEKWTLDFQGSTGAEGGGRISVKDEAFWC